MAALVKADSPAMVNACPYGCAVDELDERGYCPHLIGFAPPAERQAQLPRVYHPLKTRVGEDNRVRGHFVDGSDPREIPGDAHLERITSSYRVYHKQGRKAGGD
jgi:hypothetical protein